MSVEQRAGRISHVSFLLRPENFDVGVERFERALSVRFQVNTREDLKLRIAIDWDAGLELVAPTGPESPLWGRLLEKGEGATSLVFGVRDLDAAKQQAVAEGFVAGPVFGPQGDEPWIDRFERIRELSLSGLFGIEFLLGEIVPR